MPIRPSGRCSPGSQFPVEAYANYMKQSVPRWLSTDNAIIAAYLEYVDKVCPCVLLLHSQGGTFGFKVAEQRPDKIKAHRRGRVGDRGHRRQCAQAEGHPGADAVRRLCRPASALVHLQEDRHRVWQRHQGGRRHGRLDQLPDIGIKGNAHMMMQDKNNMQVAEVIQKWLVGKGLSD